MMNGSYDISKFVVRLRGLPWNTSQSEVIKFLGGCKIRRLQFVTNDQGRSTGECFVILETKEDVDLAKSFDKNMLGTRYIEIFESNHDAMSDMLRKYNSDYNANDPSNPENNLSSNDNWQEPAVRLRGLPYHATKSDISKFFDGLDIAQNGIHISSSKPAGEAFVAFVNMDNALRALEFNRMNMGHRYIEVFKSTYAEARASILNDTQMMVRQKTGGSAQRQGSDTDNTGNNNNNSSNMNQYSNIPPASNNYNIDTRNRNNYPMVHNESGPVKRSLCASFTMKLRGVPFDATEQDIYDFFNPIMPIRVEQENAVRIKASTWYVEFGSREEANEAMTYDRKYMGSRYIELLPLYDDSTRSKRNRN
ncbi:unnamed protein product [Rotaria magnacalcarata]|uniref:RRM domain-containing protein n=2 Tax=Rotaria magnacalcarata TaxID=392030 RepID=A0A815UP14_9BILA|nr:unnamed protein product [Rotaria magnacalcarata]